MDVLSGLQDDGGFAQGRRIQLIQTALDIIVDLHGIEVVVCLRSQAGLCVGVINDLVRSVRVLLACLLRGHPFRRTERARLCGNLVVDARHGFELPWHSNHPGDFQHRRGRLFLPHRLLKGNRLLREHRFWRDAPRSKQQRDDGQHHKELFHHISIRRDTGKSTPVPSPS